VRIALFVFILTRCIGAGMRELHNVFCLVLISWVLEHWWLRRTGGLHEHSETLSPKILGPRAQRRMQQRASWLIAAIPREKHSQACYIAD
jgi:hypothetical protein